MRKKHIFCLFLALLLCLTACHGASTPAERETGANETHPRETAEKEESGMTNDLLALSPLFQSHMILQRDRKITVFGSGSGTGSVTLGTETKSFTAENDYWEVEFEGLPCSSTPIVFEVQLGTWKRVLNDVLVGDVFLCSGQSNMAFKLSQSEQAQTGAVASSLLRFRDSATRRWQAFTAENTQELSAIGALFAIDLSRALDEKIPIGIVPAAVGASRVEEWTSPEYADREPYLSYLANPHSDLQIYTNPRPSLHDCWERYIAPLTRLSFAGVLWYQGESNRGGGEAPYYYELFLNLVNCWRDAFKDPELPFYTVQIMLHAPDVLPDANGNPTDEYNIRIGQWKAAVSIPNVTLCTFLSLEETLDSKGSLNIHPTDKQPVADALANAVLNVYYHENGEYPMAPEYSGPLCSGVSVSGRLVTVSFDHVGDGLKLLTGTTVHEMELQLADGSWIPASDAIISGNTVVITAPEGSNVTGVRMGYRNKPFINLYNQENGKVRYCASPFLWELSENAFSPYGIK